MEALLVLLVVLWSGLNELPRPKPTVLLAGDSFSVGMAPEFRALARAQGYEPYTEGQNGTRIDQWAKWLPRKLDLYHPKVVYLSLGTNDAVSGGTPIHQNPDLIRQIIEDVRARNATLVWVGPPTLPPKICPEQDWVRAAIMVRAPLYFDSSRLVIERAGDQIHSTPKGYQIWMDEIWDWSHLKGVQP